MCQSSHRLPEGSERDRRHILSVHECAAPPVRWSGGRGAARPRARPDRVVRPRARLHRPPDQPGAGHLRGERRGPVAARRGAIGPRPPVQRRRRRRGVRAGPPGAAGVGAHPAGRARRRAAAPARPRPGPAGRDPRPGRAGVRQGPQARLRRAAAHRAHRPLLRAHRPPVPRHPAPARRGPRPHPRRAQPGPQGRRRDHLAVELPVHDGAVRRTARAAGRQRRRRQARRADHAHRAARGRAARAGGHPARPVAGGGGAGLPGRARRSSSAPTTSASPAAPPPAGSWPRAAPSGWSAARWSSAARTRCWCCATPTRSGPRRARCGRRSRTPASCASPPSGCSWPTRSTTASSTGSWPAPRR